MIEKLGDAETFLARHYNEAVSELGAELALTFAASALYHRFAPKNAPSLIDFIGGIPALNKAARACSHVLNHSQSVFDSICGHAEFITPDALGLLYEAARDAALVAKEGSVYTPQWLAAELVSKALADGPGLVLDPACGGGVFLLAALRAATIDGETDPVAALSTLFGVDRDESAVQVTRAALLLCLPAEISSEAFHAAAGTVGRNIRHGDTLLDRGLLTDAAPFDGVIGNPPYGLSRDARIERGEKKALAELYADARTGKMNKYLLFMARGFDLLKPGGRLAFVVPNSWLGIASGEAVRKRLLSGGSLIEVTAFLEPVFEDPSVEVVTFLARKEARCEEITITHRSVERDSATHFKLPAATCRDSEHSTIPLVWNEEVAELFAVIDPVSVKLGSKESPFQPLIALQAYARGKGSPPQTADMVRRHVYDRTSASEPDVFPYLKGGDIFRYAHRHSGKFLKHGPFLAEPQDIERFSGPRIVVREILGAPPYLIISTLVEETALYNKSVLHILPRPGAGRTQLLALLGILNSSIASLVIGYRGFKSQRRLFPKVVNADLKGFPVPRAILNDPGPLAELVQKRLAASGVEADDLERRIEQLVRAGYGISRLPVVRSFDSGPEILRQTPPDPV